MTKHQHIRAAAGPISGYVCSVAVPPYTSENRAAHGCITYDEICACGARRATLQNQTHYEYGTWGPSTEEQRAAAHAAEEAERVARWEARRARGREVAAGRRVIRFGGTSSRVTLARDTGVHVCVDGREVVLSWSDLRSAARQDDAELARYYSDVLADALALADVP